MIRYREGRCAERSFVQHALGRQTNSCRRGMGHGAIEDSNQQHLQIFPSKKYEMGVSYLLYRSESGDRVAHARVKEDLNSESDSCAYERPGIEFH